MDTRRFLPVLLVLTLACQCSPAPRQCDDCFADVEPLCSVLAEACPGEAQIFEPSYFQSSCAPPLLEGGCMYIDQVGYLAEVESCIADAGCAGASACIWDKSDAGSITCVEDANLYVVNAPVCAALEFTCTAEDQGFGDRCVSSLYACADGGDLAYVELAAGCVVDAGCTLSAPDCLPIDAGESPACFQAIVDVMGAGALAQQLVAACPADAGSLVEDQEYFHETDRSCGDPSDAQAAVSCLADAGCTCGLACLSSIQVGADGGPTSQCLQFLSYLVGARAPDAGACGP